MTLLWLSQNFLMINSFSWISHHLLIPFWWLSHVFLLPFSWLSHKSPLTFSCLSHEFLTTFSCLCHDFFITFFINVSCLSHNYLINRAPTEPGKRILQKGRIYRMVLCLHTAIWPGRGPCLAETVRDGSRDRFLFLFGNGSNKNRQLGLLGRDSPEREQRDKYGFVQQWLEGTRPH